MPPFAVQHYNTGEQLSRCYYTGSDTLRKGYALCLDFDSSNTGGTVSDYDERQINVEKPAMKNLPYFYGVVAPTYDGHTGPGWIDVIRPTGVSPGLEVWTDGNIAVGDLLSIQPGSYAFRKGVLFPKAQVVLRAIEAIDRSSTAGTVIGLFGSSIGHEEWVEKHLVFGSDFNSYVTTQEGLTSSLGTSATAAAASSVLTLTTTNVDDIQAIVSSTVALTPRTVGKPFFLGGKVTPTEAGTNAGNFFFGLHDGTIGATIPVSASNALTASNENFAIFHKLAAATVWSFSTNDEGATATATATTVATGSGTQREFGILWDGVSSILAFIDGNLVATHTTDLPLTTASLKFVMGALASTTEIEILASDYFRFVAAK